MNPEVERDLRKFLGLPKMLSVPQTKDLERRRLNGNKAPSPQLEMSDKVDWVFKNLDLPDNELATLMNPWTALITARAYEKLQEMPHRLYRPYGQMLEVEDSIFTEEIKFTGKGNRFALEDHSHIKLGMEKEAFELECAKFIRCIAETYLCLHAPQELEAIRAAKDVHLTYLNDPNREYLRVYDRAYDDTIR